MFLFAESLTLIKALPLSRNQSCITPNYCPTPRLLHLSNLFKRRQITSLFRLGSNLPFIGTGCLLVYLYCSRKSAISATDCATMPSLWGVTESVKCMFFFVFCQHMASVISYIHTITVGKMQALFQNA